MYCTTRSAFSILEHFNNSPSSSKYIHFHQHIFLVNVIFVFCPLLGKVMEPNSNYEGEV
jgi:hypothetical protein